MRPQDRDNRVFKDCKAEKDFDFARCIKCASCSFNARSGGDIYDGVMQSANAHQVANDVQIGGDHYKGMKITPTEYIVANKIPWRDGNAIKYISRHRFKNGKEDIEKAIHYLQLILETDYAD